MGRGAYEVRIRVDGELPASWRTVFDGVAMVATSEGATSMEGRVPDQAALHGLLAAVRDLGLCLVSIDARLLRDGWSFDVTTGARPPVPKGPGAGREKRRR
jgi:hypothetical protein